MPSIRPRVPSSRIRVAASAPVRAEGSYVLHWMISARRTGWNHGLQRAVEWGQELGRPLLVLEALRAGYRWASIRHHRFALDGMADNRDALAGTGVGYLPYVEDRAGAGSGLLERLAAEACVVVTDDTPVFFLPRMLAAAAERMPVRMEAVDSVGLLPLSAAGRDFTTAYSFRRFLQKTLPDHLEELPLANPLANAGLPPFSGLPAGVGERWPAAPPELLERSGSGPARLPVDQTVGVVEERGGSGSASRRLEGWLGDGFHRYHEARNDPGDPVASGLSPWLHWGHISPHQIFLRVAELEGWNPGRLSTETHGRREGWWGMGEAAEAFLDELVTWREIGHVTAHRVEGHERYESLPGWSRATLEEHSADPRPHVYTYEEFRDAETHDPLWNAAQRQLLGEGRIHNYLRMLWGKKILEWTRSPREALEVMLELNNRYALDGRDPNSTSGIFWVLGRYDRGWPERPVYGTVRSMTSASTRRKVSVEGYLERWKG
jgi:deoxyribodipyrimidine photo-lyase